MGKKAAIGTSYNAYRAGDGRWRPPRPEGLARVLAKAGYGARIRTTDMVLAGRITVDGSLVDDPGVAVTPDSDVHLDGRPLREAPRRYIAVHKPPGHECTVHGLGGRTLITMVPGDAVGLEPAGRLDGRASGLVLVSNDLRWNTTVTGSTTLERRYEVIVKGPVTPVVLDVIRAGITLPSQGQFRPDTVEIVTEGSRQTRLAVSLRGDHARKIRTAFTSLRFEVVTMIRSGLGPVSLGTMPRGRWWELTPEERDELAPPQARGSRS